MNLKKDWDKFNRLKVFFSFKRKLNETTIQRNKNKFC